MDQFIAEAGTFPLFLLCGVIVAIGIIATVSVTDSFGNVPRY